METVSLLFGFIVLVASGVIIWLGRRFEQQTPAALSQLAAERDWQFHPLGDSGLQQRLEKFELLRKGQNRKIVNLLTEEKDDCRISVSDYHFSDLLLGTAKTKLTVVALESPRLRNPAFTLRPEFLLDKFGERTGPSDIDFEDNVSFSRGYWLTSPEEEETRKFFHRALQDFFVQRPPGCCVEATRGTIIFYNALRRGQVNPKRNDFLRLMEEAHQLLQLTLDR